MTRSFLATKTHLIQTNPRLLPYPNNSMSYMRAIRIKGKAVKALANDNTGNHPHVVTEVCDTLKYVTVNGHNTHKPMIGRFTRFISSIDSNNKENAQYFVKTNDEKKATNQEINNHGKDIKNDSKSTSFVNNNRDKYE